MKHIYPVCVAQMETMCGERIKYPGDDGKGTSMTDGDTGDDGDEDEGIQAVGKTQVSPENQITIPKSIREEIKNLDKGEELVIVASDGVTEIRVVG